MLEYTLKNYFSTLVTKVNFKKVVLSKWNFVECLHFINIYIEYIYPGTYSKHLNVSL